VEVCKCASDAGDGRQLRSRCCQSATRQASKSELATANLACLRLSMNLKYEPMARGLAQAFSDSSCLVFCLNHDTCSCIRDRTSNVDVVRLPSDAEFQDACTDSISSQRCSLHPGNSIFLSFSRPAMNQVCTSYSVDNSACRVTERTLVHNLHALHLFLATFTSSPAKFCSRPK
jgi:hypothetical protein